ncbi:hypothetical protein [Aliiglaciecola litoralis]|uniref:MSHA biogenesis protein MshF n=1 Tax=Aliiglaciecola litoralis TaxID=582857 RepID=A0ABN1LIK7_9ALTE
MDRFEAGQESTNTLFSKIAVLFVFVALMTSFVLYFNNSDPDVKYLAMENLQQRFSQSVTNSHWQWQAEGRPRMIVLVHYESQPGGNASPVEKDRRPIQMGLNGYPVASASAEGCAKIWQMILNMPLEIKGFKVFAEYFADTDGTDAIDDAKCRYRLSVGPSFEYQLANGRVSTLTR